MPTLLDAYRQAETIAGSANASGELSSRGAEVLRNYFATLEKNALDVYQAARMVASHIYDRREIAKFWQRESELAAGNLETFDRLNATLKVHLDFPRQRIRQTLSEIHEACLAHVELHE